jgi:hypothetical protein
MGKLLGDVEDSKYLGIGKHRVKVSTVEFSQSKNFQPCVTYTFRDMEGATANKKLSLQDKALWKLKTLIVALGLPKEHVAVFDSGSLRHHQKMIGKDLWIELTPPEGDSKYPELDKWWSVAGQTEQKRQAEEGQRTAEDLKTANEPDEPRYTNEDDIPF